MQNQAASASFTMTPTTLLGYKYSAIPLYDRPNILARAMEIFVSRSGPSPLLWHRPGASQPLRGLPPPHRHGIGDYLTHSNYIRSVDPTRNLP